MGELFDWCVKYIPEVRYAMSQKRGPGAEAVNKAAEALENTYHRVIERLANASPYDEVVKGQVKQLINEFADLKADIYENG